jgi:hypothetical protein
LGQWADKLDVLPVQAIFYETAQDRAASRGYLDRDSRWLLETHEVLAHPRPKSRTPAGSPERGIAGDTAFQLFCHPYSGESVADYG